MSRISLRGRLVAAALTTAVAAGATSSAEASLSIVKVGTPRTVIAHKDARGQDAYDYAPTTMYENGGYTTWWCGTGDDGRFDRIYRARSTSVGGGWNGRSEVFQGRGNRAFDGEHTCDPDVIKDTNVYTMYYGGLGNTRGGGGTSDDFTEIGVATSADGIHWSRGNSGQSIIGPKDVANGVAYGAGQPSVVRANGYYTMIYTMVSRRGRGGPLVGAEYAVRSTDHLFRSGIQELRSDGWRDRPNRAANGKLDLAQDRPLFGGDHVVNLTYLSQDGVFATISAAGDLRFLDPKTMRVVRQQKVSSPGFHEQRTFVRSRWGKVYRSKSGLYNLTLMGGIYGGGPRPATDPFSWDIGAQSLFVKSS